MDFLNEYHLAGLAIGICTFLIIGVFHPVVVKAEYYWGTRCWWVFLLLGLRCGGIGVGVQPVLVIAAGCVCFLFFLDHQGDFRAGGTRAQGLVPQKSPA